MSGVLRNSLRSSSSVQAQTNAVISSESLFLIIPSSLLQGALHLAVLVVRLSRKRERKTFFCFFVFFRMVVCFCFERIGGLGPPATNSGWRKPNRYFNRYRPNFLLQRGILLGSLCGASSIDYQSAILTSY